MKWTSPSLIGTREYFRDDASKRPQKYCEVVHLVNGLLFAGLNSEHTNEFEAVLHGKLEAGYLD